MTNGSADAEEEWFERWFGEEYLELYPHRDEDEARRAAALVAEHSTARPGDPVLDLACGAGRHLVALRVLGFRACGLDLSHPLLLRARDRAPVVRGDMRVLPFRSGSFTLVTSFFTSFGYFEDTGDDRQVLDEVRRVLRNGGSFSFDYLNADRVRAELRPRDEREVNGRRVVQTRELVDGGSAVHKEIRIYAADGAAPRVFHERVRLYAPDQFQALLRAHGLQVQRTFGDYQGSAFRSDSPRLLVVGTVP